MAQIHCYVPDDIARKLGDKARAAGLPVSRYLASLIRKEMETPWPEGYFELFGQWQGEPLERPEQGNFEQRDGFN